jgi:hypothetical protein
MPAPWRFHGRTLENMKRVVILGRGASALLKAIADSAPNAKLQVFRDPEHSIGSSRTRPANHRPDNYLSNESPNYCLFAHRVSDYGAGGSP